MGMTKIRGQQIQLDSTKGIDVDGSGKVFVLVSGTSTGFNGSGNIVVLGVDQATGSAGLDGNMWFDTNDKQIKTVMAGQTYSEVGCLLADPGNGTTISSSSAENDVDSNKRLTVVGNFLKTNRVIRIRQVFRYSTTGTPTITARIRITTGVPSNDIVLTCTVTCPNNASNLYGIFECIVVASTGGTTASIRCSGRLDLGGSTASVSATSGISVDVTGSTVIKPTYQWSASSASNALRPELITYEVLN